MSLIYCAGAGRKSMAVARSCGWLPGLRSDEQCADEHRPVYLLDSHWERYDWPRHVAMARAERPALVVVPDVMTPAGLPLALAQAEEIAPYATVAVVIVPKLPGIAEQIPLCIGGRPVRLAYSVPTRYGGATVAMWEFGRRPVHLLGGSPSNQVKLAHWLNVVSADGNMSGKVSRWGIVFEANGKRRTVADIDGARWPADADLPYEALRRSLVNIPALWRRAGFEVSVREESKGEVQSEVRGGAATAGGWLSHDPAGDIAGDHGCGGARRWRR